MRFWPMLLCVALCGCGSGAERNLQVTAANPPDGASVRKNVDAIVQEYKLEAPIEISHVREASPLAPAEWIVCVRGNTKKRRLIVAAFYRGPEKIATREALPLDQCERDAYTAWRKK